MKARELLSGRDRFLLACVGVVYFSPVLFGLLGINKDLAVELSIILPSMTGVLCICLAIIPITQEKTVDRSQPKPLAADTTREVYRILQNAERELRLVSEKGDVPITNLFRVYFAIRDVMKQTHYLVQTDCDAICFQLVEETAQICQGLSTLDTEHVNRIVQAIQSTKLKIVGEIVNSSKGD